MKKFLFIGLAIFLYSNLLGQNENESGKYRLKEDLSSIFKIGYSYQKSHFIEAGYGYGLVLLNRIAPYAVIGPYIQLEYSPIRQNNILGEKIGFEFSYVILSSKISFTRYKQNNNVDFVLTPEIGLTIFSIISFTYGYNFNTTQKLINDISKNKFSICINISPHYND